MAILLKFNMTYSLRMCSDMYDRLLKVSTIYKNIYISDSVILKQLS